MRVLALDIGEKNIGLAISDKLGWTAQGLFSLKRKTKEKDIGTLAEIIKEKDVSEIVVGMPLNLDGTLGKKAQDIAEFIEDLEEKISTPVKIWDERLTSAQAERVMIEADASRRKRKRKIDKLAAQLILQSYLDSKTRFQDVQKGKSE